MYTRFPDHRGESSRPHAITINLLARNNYVGQGKWKKMLELALAPARTLCKSESLLFFCRAATIPLFNLLQPHPPLYHHKIISITA